MSPERELKEKTLLIFSTVAGFVLIAFSVVNFLYYSRNLGVFELLSGFLLLFNVLIYRTHKNLRTATFLFLLILLSLFTILILTGGIKNTGIFWSFSFPLMTFFLESSSIALVWNSLFLVNVLFIHYLSAVGVIQTPYSSGTLLWFIPIYIVFTAPAFIYSKLVNRVLATIYDTAIKDPLTGIYNRAFALAFLKKAIEQVKRRELHNLCISYIDLDNFKFVNDMYGHTTGDRVLREVAIFFENSFRKSDVVARIGGDEFLIIFTNCNRAFIEKRIEKLKEEFEKSFREYYISISYGVAVYPEDADSLECLLEVADRRMYEKKLEAEARSAMERNPLFKSRPNLQQQRPDCSS